MAGACSCAHWAQRQQCVEASPNNRSFAGLLSWPLLPVVVFSPPPCTDFQISTGGLRPTSCPAGFSIPDPYVGVVPVVGQLSSPGFRVYTSYYIDIGIAPNIPPTPHTSLACLKAWLFMSTIIYIYICVLFCLLVSFFLLDLS